MVAAFRGGAKAKALARSQRNGAKLGLFHETAKFGGVENSENSKNIQNNAIYWRSLT